MSLTYPSGTPVDWFFKNIQRSGVSRPRTKEFRMFALYRRTGPRGPFVQKDRRVTILPPSGRAEKGTRDAGSEATACAHLTIQDEIGITILPMEEMLYIPEDDQSHSSTQTTESDLGTFLHRLSMGAQLCRSPAPSCVGCWFFAKMSRPGMCTVSHHVLTIKVQPT